MTTTTISFVPMAAVSILLPVTTKRHLAPCQEALKYLMSRFRDGCTISQALPRGLMSPDDGIPVWHGLYQESKTAPTERDAHVLFTALWKREELSDADLRRKISAVESRLHRIYAHRARRTADRHVYQVEIFIQVNDARLAAVNIQTKKVRSDARQSIPERSS